MRKHFFDAWPSVIGSLNESHILLLLDFDGTLSPIVNRASEAVLPPGTWGVLKELSTRDWCTIAVISGRTLANLIEKVRIEGIIYGGSHGAQLKGPNIDFLAPLSAETYRALETIKWDLRSQTASMKGVVIEDKAHSLSIHYREVAKGGVSQLNRTVYRILRPFIDDGYVRINNGKKVFDIMPSSWNKGKAVEWLLSRVSLSVTSKSVVPIYVGDDATDEDAFAAIGQNGLTIIVGNGRRSAAQYSLRDTDEVLALLEKMLLLKNQ